MLSLHKVMVIMPESVTPRIIYTNLKLFLFFRDCIGALDGTQIPACVPASEAIPFRNRNGFLSQNVFAACKFNLYFSYILPGWEGSAHDSRVLWHALDNDFQISEENTTLPTQDISCKREF
jgi:hypothetical protein